MFLNENYKIYGYKEVINKKNQVAMTIGNFDGVHSGHCYLIQELKKISQSIPIVVVTFDPHPAVFFSKDKAKSLLNTLEDKIKILLSSGVDTVVVQKFTKEFSLLTADDFCMWLKNNFNINTIMLGHDFCYGNHRSGNFEHMKLFAEKENWNIKQVPAFKLFGKKIVSSSLIRELLIAGDVEEVEKLLSRPYFLHGTVIKGDQRGRLMGFPTANIMLDDALVIPKYGVYACLVEIESNNVFLPAIMNCGVRPTVGSNLALCIESYIFNFYDEIYNRKVKFHIKKYIREEMKFGNIESLKEQISKDIQVVKTFFHI